MSELICSGCEQTSHVTWDGTGSDRKVINLSENLRMQSEPSLSFYCVKCGTRQEV
jgi:hypothetical protein